MRLIGVILAIAAGLIVAPPAAATDADDAREFSYAAYRLRVAVKTQGPEIARRQAEVSRCWTLAERAPRRVRDEAMRLAFAAEVLAFIDVARAPLATFVAELDRIPVRDDALRRGRAAWRGNVADLATVAPLPAGLYDQFARWRDAGYTDGTRPAVDVKGLRRLTDAEATTKRRERRLKAAVRRMRELGVRRGTAERFTGERLFDGIPELEIEVIE